MQHRIRAVAAVACRGSNPPGLDLSPFSCALPSVDQVSQSDRYLCEVLGPVQHKLERSALEGLKMTTAETALLTRRSFVEAFRATAQEVETGEWSAHHTG
jgi:hypothetical protein